MWSLLGNSQRLDGGSMFGNAPRAVWERWIAPDERHRIPLACRCLLVEEDNGRRLLFEAGIGAFFNPKMRDRFGVQESNHVLLDSLAKLGLTHRDIDVVVLSHLHFDHAGGLLDAWSEDAAPRLLFDNATYVIGEDAWNRACDPHPRDRASFIPELTRLLMESERVSLVSEDRSAVLGEGYRLHYSNGHTPGLLVTEIEHSNGPLVFASDMIPGAPWVHLPITMGYDRFPEGLIDEKRVLLSDLSTRGGRLFFTHDPAVASAKVAVDERGRFCAVDSVEALMGQGGVS